MSEDAKKKAVEMARLERIGMNSWWKNGTIHCITDNPYDRIAHKKEHVAWHNAFRAERKIMKRGLM